jgi:hypothetical protein
MSATSTLIARVMNGAMAGMLPPLDMIRRACYEYAACRGFVLFSPVPIPAGQTPAPGYVAPLSTVRFLDRYVCTTKPNGDRRPLHITKGYDASDDVEGILPENVRVPAPETPADCATFGETLVVPFPVVSGASLHLISRQYGFVCPMRSLDGDWSASEPDVAWLRDQVTRAPVATVLQSLSMPTAPASSDDAALVVWWNVYGHRARIDPNVHCMLGRRATVDATGVDVLEDSANFDNGAVCSDRPRCPRPFIAESETNGPNWSAARTFPIDNSLLSTARDSLRLPCNGHGRCLNSACQCNVFWHSSESIRQRWQDPLRRDAYAGAEWMFRADACDFDVVQSCTNQLDNTRTVCGGSGRCVLHVPFGEGQNVPRKLVCECGRPVYDAARGRFSVQPAYAGVVRDADGAPAAYPYWSSTLAGGGYRWRYDEGAEAGGVVPGARWPLMAHTDNVGALCQGFMCNDFAGNLSATHSCQTLRSPTTGPRGICTPRSTASVRRPDSTPLFASGNAYDAAYVDLYDVGPDVDGATDLVVGEKQTAIRGTVVFRDLLDYGPTETFVDMSAPANWHCAVCADGLWGDQCQFEVLPSTVQQLALNATYTLQYVSGCQSKPRVCDTSAGTCAPAEICGGETRGVCQTSIVHASAPVVMAQQCVCRPGWTGPTCTEIVCTPACSRPEFCVADVSTGAPTCKCPLLGGTLQNTPAFTGSTCAVPNCGVHGTPRQTDGGVWYCECDRIAAVAASAVPLVAYAPSWVSSFLWVREVDGRCSDTVRACPGYDYEPLTQVFSECGFQVAAPSKPSVCVRPPLSATPHCACPPDIATSDYLTAQQRMLPVGRTLVSARWGGVCIDNARCEGLHGVCVWGSTTGECVCSGCDVGWTGATCSLPVV